MNQNELFYLAGLFDGEGWACISKCVGKIHRMKHPCYSLAIELVMREKYLVEKFLAFGGSIGRQWPRKSTHSITYRWSVSGTEAMEFAKIFCDLCQAKGQQLRLAIRFQKLKERRKNKYTPISNSIVLSYEKMWNQMKVLNQKGVGK